MATDLKTLQRRMDKRLPEQIKTAMADYVAFCQTPVPDDAKAFSLYQQACKNALSHVLMLMKLASLVHPGPVDTGNDEEMWIKAAQMALTQTGEDDDDT